MVKVLKRGDVVKINKITYIIINGWGAMISYYKPRKAWEVTYFEEIDKKNMIKIPYRKLPKYVKKQVDLYKRK